jgi:hypothetical protein
MSVIKTTFAVGRRWRCTMVCDPSATVPGSRGMMRAEWGPALPNRPLNKSELRQYREGRNSFFAKVAEVSKMNYLLVEV